MGSFFVGERNLVQRSYVTVCTEYSEAWWIFVVLQPQEEVVPGTSASVTLTDLSSMLVSFASDVVHLQKDRLGFAATNTDRTSVFVDRSIA
jgi:hypothetical protein